jgi:hypothetical protein
MQVPYGGVHGGHKVNLAACTFVDMKVAEPEYFRTHASLSANHFAGSMKTSH